MKSFTTLTLIVASLIGLAFPGESTAKDFGKMLKKQVIRHLEREIRHAQPAPLPHCKPGHPCPQPRPYPQPLPAVCHYYLGVWVAEVQMDVASLPAGALNTGPTAQVVPGQGQPVLALQIDRVAEYSPACLAGLEPGDVLLAANGRAIQYKCDLDNVLKYCGGRLELVVLDTRTGQLTTVVAPIPSAGRGGACRRESTSRGCEGTVQFSRSDHRSLSDGSPASAIAISSSGYSQSHS